MTTYICKVDVEGNEYQNAHELLSIWGNIRNDVDELGGEIIDTYAILGEFDFLIIYSVPDEDVAFKVTQVIERRGMDTKTMQGIPLDHLGQVIDDI